jgi:gentisate 1,2-dioxygenase
MGTGWVQEEGGEKRLMQPGDVIWTPPGLKHWHGATDTTSVKHIAIQQYADGSNVEWMEHVTDEESRLRLVRKRGARPRSGPAIPLSRYAPDISAH